MPWVLEISRMSGLGLGAETSRLGSAWGAEPLILGSARLNFRLQSAYVVNNTKFIKNPYAIENLQCIFEPFEYQIKLTNIVYTKNSQI